MRKYDRKTFALKVNAPIDKVFDGVSNPEFTPLWALGIKKEVASELPPKLGTVYSSISYDSNDAFELVVDQLNKPVLIGMSSGTFHETYKLKKISENITMLYFCKWFDDKNADYTGQQERLKKLVGLIEKEYSIESR
ncbi:MAG: hypothetical protein WC137_00835 [Alphaproteobacteria bacterium]